MGVRGPSAWAGGLDGGYHSLILMHILNLWKKKISKKRMDADVRKCGGEDR
jgi:hypothetical protein